MATFEPDERIDSIKVKVHTADVADGGTDDDVYVELFNWPEGTNVPDGFPFTAEIDTDNYNDFERGDKDTYHLPSAYFANRIVNDIRRVRVIKSSDGLWGGWAFAGITVWVNGKELYSSVDPNKPLGVLKWLEDDDRAWKAGNFQPIEFTAPVITSLGLRDAGSNENYSVELTARGGRKPLTWTLVSQTGSAFSSAPKLLAPSSDGTRIRLEGHTAETSTSASWSGTFEVRDAEDRTTTATLSMKAVHTLPAPTVEEVVPDFGWPGLDPAAPLASELIIKGKDFDSRAKQNTTVLFPDAGGGTIETQVLESTSKELRLRVPSGAASGALTVKTAFGEADSPEFTVHQDGYRLQKGFRFSNWIKDDTNDDGFPDVFAWERFEQTFGVCEMWICVAGHGTVPNPVATANYLLLHDTIDNGCCHGFALTSLQMVKGIIPMSVYPRQELDPPLADTIFDLAESGRPSSGLSKTIQSRQLVIFSEEALMYYLNRLDKVPNVEGLLCQMDGRPALNDMKHAVDNDLTNPRMLAFAKNCAPWDGHVVVPYHVEPPVTSAGITSQSIRVYDPNRPGFPHFSSDAGKAARQQTKIERSRFNVRTGDGRWSYQWGDGSSDGDNSIWDGLYMFTIPLSEYGHQEDWSLPGLGTLAATVDLLLGSAGVAGDGAITQVTDDSGRALFGRDGSTIPDRSMWPTGVQPIPLFDPSGTKRSMVVFTSESPLRFQVTAAPRRRGHVPEPMMFGLTRGGSFTVEEIDADLTIDFDPREETLRITPVAGTTSAIVRLVHRFSETSECLSYALRVADLAPDNPLTVRPVNSGRAIVLDVAAADRHVDVEIIRTTRIGEQRILQHDGINLRAGHTVKLKVPDLDLLGQDGASPLQVVSEGADGKERTNLGEHVTGPRVEAPTRVLVTAPRPKITTRSQPDESLLRRTPVAKLRAVFRDIPQVRAIADTRTKTPLFDVPVRAHGLAIEGATAEVRSLETRFGAGTVEADGLHVRVPLGTRPVRLVAEDDAGRRSFPRTVFVTVAGESEVPRSPIMVFGEDIAAEPGTDITIPLSMFVDSDEVTGVELDLSVRRRIAGAGTSRLSFPTESFTAAETLHATNAAQPGRGGLTVKVTAAWKDPSSGTFGLGELRITVPQDVPLGSTFALDGVGTVQLNGGRSLPVTVVPSLIRAWGGPEPSELSIAGPASVVEGTMTTFDVAVGGMRGNPDNIGWWVETLSGRATVDADPAAAHTGVLSAHRAGWIILHVVVGTTRAQQVIRVHPAVDETRTFKLPLEMMTKLQRARISDDWLRSEDPKKPFNPFARIKALRPTPQG